MRLALLRHKRVSRCTRDGGALRLASVRLLLALAALRVCAAQPAREPGGRCAALVADMRTQALPRALQALRTCAAQLALASVDAKVLLLWMP
jgi:hypothetical protein